MASKMQSRNFLKEKDAKHTTKPYQDELPDEIALRDEILQLKKQILLLRKANERYSIKVRKYEDEAKRKDRQIEQLMDPIKNGDVRKVLSTKGAVLLMNLKEQNNTLVQMILDKDVQIRRLLAEIKTSKLYAKKIRPESYKTEIDRLRNLLIKSQNVLKEAQDVSRGKAICVERFSTSEMHLSSNQSSPRDLEELQETVRSLEKHMKYSNDLIAKKNEQIIQLMDHLNAAMNINKCGVCKENVTPQYKLDSDVNLRNFFQNGSRHYEEKGIFSNDEVKPENTTMFRVPYTYGQTRFHSSSIEHLDKIFSPNKNKIERLTNSAAEKKFKNLQYKNYDSVSNPEEGLNKVYCTDEYSVKDNVAKKEELEIKSIAFDVLNTMENINEDESQISNTTENLGNRENKRSDVQNIKRSSFDEFDNIKEMENDKKLYPISISVFSTQDIISTHKTQKSSEDSKSTVSETLDDYDMETDEFEAMENKIENEIELESLLKIQKEENELKWTESNAESQIIKLNESPTESKKTEKSTDDSKDKHIKAIQDSAHFEPTKNICLPEANNGKRFDEQHYEETKAGEKDHLEYLFDDHISETSERTLPNSDFSNEASQSENETETLTCASEHTNSRNQEDEKAFCEKETHQNGIKGSFGETEKKDVQTIPEENVSTNDSQKSFIYNQKLVYSQEIYPQNNSSSRDSVSCYSMAQELKIKPGDENNTIAVRFNENLKPECLTHEHNETNNKLISFETYRDEDDDDVVVGLIC